jgi:NADH-quinone oxidoreductase subunit M
MLSHGVIAGLLFAVVGRMVYDRAHSRDFSVLSGLRLNRTLPFAAGTFALTAMASMGMPGFSGFVAELQVLVGTWKAFPALTAVAGLGIAVGVAYNLRAFQKAFFPGRAETTGELSHFEFEPISWPERAGGIFLLLVSLGVGLYPAPLLRLIASGLESPLFNFLGKGAGVLTAEFTPRF